MKQWAWLVHMKKPGVCFGLCKILNVKFNYYERNVILLYYRLENSLVPLAKARSSQTLHNNVNVIRNMYFALELTFLFPITQW